MDISWIIEQERLENIDKRCKRENLSNIELVSIYINTDMEIETIEKETMEIKDTKLNRELLNEWRIQKQKHTPKSTFELKETLLFHVDLETEQIKNINENTSCFLRTFQPLEEIKLTPAIFIFHTLTTLFFVFYETKNYETKNYETEKPKKTDKKKHTLRIIIPTKHKNQMRITRKNPIHSINPK